MKVNGRKVERYLQSVIMDMYANKRTQIRCLCTRCKEGVILDRFDHDSLKAHLLIGGFMDGYTRWISEDDDEDVHMAGNKDMGLDKEMTDRKKTMVPDTASVKSPDTATGKSLDMASEKILDTTK